MQFFVCRRLTQDSTALQGLEKLADHGAAPDHASIGLASMPCQGRVDERTGGGQRGPRGGPGRYWGILGTEQGCCRACGAGSGLDGLKSVLSACVLIFIFPDETVRAEARICWP